MSKILITAKDLNIGGIEKSLITLIDYLIDKNNIVTLVLQNIEGELLKELNEKAIIKKYTPSENKNKVIRKTTNLIKKMLYVIKNKNKYDISISYATYLKWGSFVARNSSKNSILWCHADYLSLFNKNKDKVEEFFEDIYFYKFKKIVFVSKQAQKSFLKIFPMQKNTYYCNNLIDYNKIYNQTQEKIDLKYNKNLPTFLNVGRHDEAQKKVSRIIKASAKLKKEHYKFRVILVGDGKDSVKYKKLVKKYKLQKNVIFTGAKENPYPYYKISNWVILSSDYEGYPVVFLESYLLNKPIITTNVSDYEEVRKGRGLVIQKNSESIYKAMKKVLENGYVIKNKFNPIKYNQSIIKKLNQIIQEQKLSD